MQSPKGAALKSARTRRAIAVVAIGVIMFVASSCGDDTTPVAPTPTPVPTPTPTPIPTPTPVPDPPTLTCPADVQVESPTGQPVAVTLPAASVRGGAPPVVTTCTPDSTQRFPVGTTLVTCTAADSMSRTSSCTFRVIVSRPPPLPPKLSVTRFLAFGDSLTEGKTSLTNGVLTLVLPDAYTFKLQDLLARRYLTQSFVVINNGVGGETTLQGVIRLPDSLAVARPEAVLLMEGANDLLAFGSSGIRDAVNNVAVMVRQSRIAGAHVLLATLPPQRPNTQRGAAAAIVPDYNDRVKQVATEQGAMLVDVFAAFRGDLTLVGPDGLHLTEAGYQRVAEAFFDVIKSTFEIPSSTTIRHLTTE